MRPLPAGGLKPASAYTSSNENQQQPALRSRSGSIPVRFLCRLAYWRASSRQSCWRLVCLRRWDEHWVCSDVRAAASGPQPGLGTTLNASQGAATDEALNYPAGPAVWQPSTVRVIRAQLDGPDAELGRVHAADVARLILGLERALARAAYLVLNKRWRGTGRHAQTIENATRLRFVGVEQGSVVGVLALPDAAPTEDELPLTVEELSSQAFDRLLDAISDYKEERDRELADAVARMAAELGIGDRSTSLILADQSALDDSRPRRSVRVDVHVRRQMQVISSATPDTREGTLVGVLFEADFEQQSAKLRLADNSVVVVSFPERLSDVIQEALRSRAGFEGVTRYDPRTSQATGVELRAVIRSTQLALAGESFWHPRSFSELQAEQGTTGQLDPAELKIPGLTEDEQAAFLSEYAE